MTPPFVADVGISGAGTVYLFHLHTTQARAWAEEHVSDDRQMFGTALAVEHRCVAALAAGMIADGLVVCNEGAF
jgi:hypothetical protein